MYTHTVKEAFREPFSFESGNTPHTLLPIFRDYNF